MPGFPARSAEANFLIGSAYYRQAREMPSAAVKAIWPRAIEHLQEALAQGGLDADRAALQYRLGYALYQQDRSSTRAIDLMTQSVEKGTLQPIEGYRLLIDANYELKAAI